MRDNAGENVSKRINAFFKSKGVKNYFSTPNEQWQDGLSEASIKSVLMLTKAEMAQSCMAGRFWFSASTHAKNCRNVTYKQRIGTTPHAKLYGTNADFSKFRPPDAEHICISTKNDVNLESTHQGQSKQFISDWPPTAI